MKKYNGNYFKIWSKARELLNQFDFKKERFQRSISLPVVLRTLKRAWPLWNILRWWSYEATTFSRLSRFTIRASDEWKIQIRSYVYTTLHSHYAIMLLSTSARLRSCIGLKPDVLFTAGEGDHEIIHPTICDRASLCFEEQRKIRRPKYRRSMHRLTWRSTYCRKGSVTFDFRTIPSVFAGVSAIRSWPNIVV